MSSLLDEDEFRRWRSEADRALEGARVQATASLHNWSCFLAEQAAQLAIKGFLHGIGQAPWGHDLVRLGQLAASSGTELPEDVAARLRRLSRHYVPARYPDALPGGPPGSYYGPSDSVEAVGDAEALVAFVDAAWEALGG